MKFIKLFLLLTAAAFAVSLVSCAGGLGSDDQSTSETSAIPEISTAAETEEELTQINVTALIGPTGMGMAKLMEKNELGTAGNKYEFTLSSAPDEVTASLINGTTDIAALPVNLASVLYNKTEGKIQLAAVNTLGVLYLLENGDTIGGIEDLRGKTIYATGQGSTPEYALRYLLSESGIDPDKDVTIEFLAEHAELATLMAAGEINLGMLPEPNVTSVLNGNSDIRIALDLNAEWQKLTGMPIIQGCLVVRTEFAQANPEAVGVFLNEYKESIEYTLSNIPDASQLIEKYGILPKAAIAEKALPRCNIVYQDAAGYKEQITGFLEILYAFNPKAVGGALPGDDFIYNK